MLLAAWPLIREQHSTLSPRIEPDISQVYLYFVNESKENGICQGVSPYPECSASVEVKTVILIDFIGTNTANY